MGDYKEKTIFSLIAGMLVLGLFYGCDRQSDQASTDEIKIGVILDLQVQLSHSHQQCLPAELAMKEASDSGLLLGGATVSSVRADQHVLMLVRQLQRPN